ncbi:MAG: PAS domain S-box protein [Eubacteriales bacterium]|nr:PAS domain S-box protein [Eubacteriales bacterium]
MIAFKEENEEVEFAYIYTFKEGVCYFMVDSELPDSINYSPPGQKYDEASEQDSIPFETREAAIFEPITDRWGTWVSAVAPIIDHETGEVFAVFRIDYPAAYWNAQITRHMMQDVAILGFIFLILLGLYLLQLKNRRLKSISEKLEKSEALFRTVFEQAPVGIALVDDFHFHSDVNTKLLNILGRTKTELATLNWTEITHPDDLQKDLDQFARFTAGEIPGYSMEKRFRRPDGTYIWTNMVVAEMQIKEELKGKRHLAIISDINNRKLAEEALSESERSKSLLLSNLPGMAYRCLYDTDWTMEFLSDGCYDLTGYQPESLLYNKEIAFNDLIVPEVRDIIRDEWARVLKLRMPFHYEYEIVTRDKEHKWVLESGQGIFSPDGTVLALEGLIIDITDARKRMDEIRYMDAHDFMTGVYNRKYYAQEKQRLDNEEPLPVSILLADINGLRMINDAFGHAEGDRMIIETARIIQTCCRKKDILARTGGDEFSILLPGTTLDEVAEVAAKIEEACEKYNELIPNSI